jgi:MbtH protein
LKNKKMAALLMAGALSITSGQTVSAGWNDSEDTTIYRVVINHEEQYSIWPADRENALGWRDAGKSGSKQECLDYIQRVWTDMRPLSLRQKMEQMMHGGSNNGQ